MAHRTKIAGAAVLLLLLALYAAHKLGSSPEWRNFQSEQFWEVFRQARWSYLAAAAALIFTSHLFRSLRWRRFLAHMKRAGLGSIYESTLIGFSAVALLGRPGELVRPVLIARREGLDVSSQMGAWTLERVFDGLMMGMLLGAGLLLFAPGQSLGQPEHPLMVHLRRAGITLVVIALLLFAALLALRYLTNGLQGFLSRVIRLLPQKQQSSFLDMLDSFIHGLGSTGNFSTVLVCGAYSFLVWAPVVGTYWCVAQSVGGAMGQMNLGSLTVVFAISIAGSIVHIPGIGGGTQVATVMALTELFAIPLAPATSAALLLWIIAFMIVLIPGIPLAAREGLNWHTLRTMAHPVK